MSDYKSILNIIETQEAMHFVKITFAEKLSKLLNLTKVSTPLFLTESSGLNDNLNGVEPPVSFETVCGERCQIVHSLAKWKRYAIGKYNIPLHHGIYTDMMAIRTTEELDAIHSYYVDQWDWEANIEKKERNINTLKKYVNNIFKAILLTQKEVIKKFKKLHPMIQNKPIKFVTTQELEDKYPNLSPKDRENEICKEFKNVFIMQIGGKLKSGKIHDGRSPDYDDWKLNGDIMIYYPPFDSALELSSMGIRVDSKSLQEQLKERNAMDRTKYDFHQGLINETLPFTIGGGIGQSRLSMVMLNKIHIGEVQASHWSKKIVDEAKEKNIILL